MRFSQTSKMKGTTVDEETDEMEQNNHDKESHSKEAYRDMNHATMSAPIM
jgi:hypothetical protein